MIASKLIRKHVAIIHAYSSMSNLQRKIFNVLLSEATKNENQIKSINSVAVESRIPFTKLSDLVGFNSKNTQYLKESLDELASLKIEWNLLKDKIPSNISFLNLRILHGSPTFYKDSTVNYSFHKVMLELVNNPSIYGTIDLELQSQFETKYGHSLYENSTRFIHLNCKKTIQLNVFRKLLGVNEDKYTTIKEFTRNVVNPSCEEVNERSKFTVKLDSVKTGRKITAYELSVKEKIATSKKANTYISSLRISSLKDKLISLFGNINNKTFKQIITSYPEEYILEKIEYTQKHTKKDFSGYLPIAYFVSALKHNYKSIDTQITDKVDFNSKQDTPWEQELRNIQYELAHWKNMQKMTDNKESLQCFNQNILNCENKLRELYQKHQQS